MEAVPLDGALGEIAPVANVLEGVVEVCELKELVNDDEIGDKMPTPGDPAAELASAELSAVDKDVDCVDVGDELVPGDKTGNGVATDITDDVGVGVFCETIEAVEMIEVVMLLIAGLHGMSKLHATNCVHRKAKWHLSFSASTCLEMIRRRLGAMSAYIATIQQHPKKQRRSKPTSTSILAQLPVLSLAPSRL